VLRVACCVLRVACCVLCDACYALRVMRCVMRGVGTCRVTLWCSAMYHAKKSTRRLVHTSLQEKRREEYAVPVSEE
jgi:hypothetical protein